MSQSYLGTIIVFAGTFPPEGFALCDGQLLQISQYDALYNLLGTTYGGDGVSTFGVPDLRGRLALHAGTAQSGTNYPLGQKTGSETITLTTVQLPSHTHVANCVTSTGTAVSPSGAYWAQAASSVRGEGEYSTSASNATMNMTAIGIAGGSQPHPNVQPVLALNFCIALYGVYPPQS